MPAEAVAKAASICGFTPAVVLDLTNQLAIQLASSLHPSSEDQPASLPIKAAAMLAARTTKKLITAATPSFTVKNASEPDDASRSSDASPLIDSSPSVHSPVPMIPNQKAPFEFFPKFFTRKKFLHRAHPRSHNGDHEGCDEPFYLM